MKYLSFSFLLIFVSVFTSSSLAQTIYKSDSGFFTPGLKSLYIRSGSFEDTQLIGPSIGYRFNEEFDVELHAEFLSSESDLENSENRTFSTLNLGVIFGRTKLISTNYLLRSEASIYHSFTLNEEQLGEYSAPSLTSGKLSTSFYRPLTLSEGVTLFPNAGAFLGYGNYMPSFSSANLRQGFEGFMAGLRLGFDASFKFSNSFYLIASPEINIPITNQEYFDNTLLFNIQLNF